MCDVAENSVSKVDIGYLEETAHWKLESRFFPSKVGGKPAWLDLLNLPPSSDLKCSICENQCFLLCQVYAPVDDKKSCFHRSLFIFLCSDPECCQGKAEDNFRVFRCQLQRDNPFYPFDPPEEIETWRPDIRVEAHSKICKLCGCKGTSQCGKCKQVNYCCKEHQLMDWRTGHKLDCGSGNYRDTNKTLLLPEFELLIEPEVLLSEPDEVDGIDEEKLRGYEELVTEGALGSLQNESVDVDEDLMKMAASKEDKLFLKFTSRIKETPDQVIRYERGGDPLWVSDNNIPEEIPACQYCGGERQFEFEILPQMLNTLKLDTLGKSIDWGILVVYTCKENCDSGPVYKKEYLWKQDFAVK